MKSQTNNQSTRPGVMLGTTTVALPGSLPQTRDFSIANIAASDIPSQLRGLFDMLSKIRLIEKNETAELVIYNNISACEERIEELESLLFSNDSALDNVVCYYNRLMPARLVTMFDLSGLYHSSGYHRAAIELLKRAEQDFFQAAENSRLIAEELADLMIFFYLELGAFGEAQKVVRRTAKLMATTHSDKREISISVAEEFFAGQLTALIAERERRANRRAERLRYFTATKTERHASNPFAQAFSQALIPQGA